MANLKEIRGRIESVKSTRQITSAMKMVAASKLRKAQDAIIQLRPYAMKLQEIFQNAGASIKMDSENPYLQERPPEKVLLVVVTSNRGLCGSFNANVIKACANLIEENYQNQQNEGNVYLYAIGKKGYDALKRRNYQVYNFNHAIFDDLNFENAMGIAGEIMQGFVEKKFDKVELVFNRFKNAAVQVQTIEQFLPMQIEKGKKEEDTEEGTETYDDYIFEPGKKELVADLLPKVLRIQFYKCLLDSNTSEHGARMTAMHQATDNATEIIRDLQLSYNKARQASITSELIEIVSGASALKG